MATLPLTPSLWVIGPVVNGENRSPGIPTNPSSPWNFTFPLSGHAGYVHSVYATPIAGKTLRMKFSITGTGTLKAKDGGSPPQVRLFFQRKGDNWSGTGAYESYRWWSTDGNAALVVPSTDIVVEAKLDPAKWTNVLGKAGTSKLTGFNAACASTNVRVGFTFGANFYGHGVYAGSGAPKFNLKEYSVL